MLKTGATVFTSSFTGFGAMVVTETTFAPLASVVDTVLTMGACEASGGCCCAGGLTVMTDASLEPCAFVVDTVLTTAGTLPPIGTTLRASAAEEGIGSVRVESKGAIHLVQIVEIEVLVTVETVLVVCMVGEPKKGVTMVVTGHVVTVVTTLYQY